MTEEKLLDDVIQVRARRRAVGRGDKIVPIQLDWDKEVLSPRL